MFVNAISLDIVRIEEIAVGGHTAPAKVWLHWKVHFMKLLEASKMMLEAKEYMGDRWVGKMYEAGEQLKKAIADAERNCP